MLPWPRLLLLITLCALPLVHGCRCLPFNRCTPWSDPEVYRGLEAELASRYPVTFEVDAILRPMGSKSVACRGADPVGMNTTFFAKDAGGESYQGEINLYRPHQLRRFDYRQRQLTNPLVARIQSQLDDAGLPVEASVFAMADAADWDLPIVRGPEALSRVFNYVSVTLRRDPNLEDLDSVDRRAKQIATDELAPFSVDHKDVSFANSRPRE